MSNFRPVCNCGKCTCGGVKELNAYFQIEYVMSFLMGLNESFAQVKGQLLLLDPIPPINKVFSLVFQEERRRTVSSQLTSTGVDSVNSLAFAIRADDAKNSSRIHQSRGNKGQNKERHFSTHCNFHGHTIEKYYKLH